MSKVCLPVHAVINTYCRKMTLDQNHIRTVYSFIYSMLKERRLHLYRIGGIENHIHMLFDLGSNFALADVMRDVKRESSKMIQNTGKFPLFEGWGKEYFAIGRSPESVGDVIEYIKNQPIHHNRICFEDEMKEFLAQGGFTWSDVLLT